MSWWKYINYVSLNKENNIELTKTLSYNFLTHEESKIYRNWNFVDCGSSSITTFLRDFYFSKEKKTLKLQNQNNDNKISHGGRNFLRNKLRGWVEHDSSNPLKDLPTSWENTERIASLNNFKQV